MFLEVVTKINTVNELAFSPLDNIVAKLPIAEWVQDAITDSLHMLPFLLFIFIAIELIEYFYSEKPENLAEKSAKTGPLAGSLLASIPQCGFSVVASTLYSNKLITTGTLLAVYLATSDEAIPVLLSQPDKINFIVPLIGIKILIALIAGYSIDLIFKTKKRQATTIKPSIEQTDDGCCHHKVVSAHKKELFLHPILHTLNTFGFILIITLILNYGVELAGGEENLGQFLLNNSPLQPVFTAIFGLIPNCAISIAITLMYIKGAIGFGSVVSGLCSGAGLGLLVLLKRNKDKKDSLKIIALLLIISIAAGLLIQFLYN